MIERQHANETAQSLPHGLCELLSAALICFCAGGLYGWSALVPVIENQYNGTTAQAGLVFSVAIVSFSLAVIVAPRLPSRFTGLRGCALFGILGAACLALAMMAMNYLVFLFAFGVGFGISSGAIYINALGTAAASARPATVTPLMVASFGLGGVVFALVWRWLIIDDWGTLALSPLLFALLMACSIAWYIASRTTAPTKVKSAVSPGLGGVQRPGTLALLWISFALGSAGGLMVLGLAGKITDSVGASSAITTLAIAGVALGNTLGRASVSAINSLLKPINTALLAVLVGVLGLIVTGLAASAFQIAIGIIVVAIGYGAVASTIPVLVNDIYGKKDFSRIYSLVFSAWGVAGLLSPWLAGMIHDRTEDFRLALLLALVSTIGAFLALLSLKFAVYRPV